MLMATVKVSHPSKRLHVDINLILLVDAQYNSANLGPRTLLGRQSGQQRGQGRTLSTIQEGSAVRTSLSARGMDQLNQSFGAMNVNVGVSNNQRGAPRSLVRQSQSVVEAPQPVQSTSQTAPAEDPKRFIPLTRQNIHDRLGNLLCRLFQVQPAKVHGWLREGLIRVDTQKYKDGVFPYDIEPLTQQLTQKDIEKWDSWVQGYDSDRALKKAIGPGQGAYVDFERDFQGSRSSRAPRPTRSSSGRYDPRCPGCRFRGGYCGGVDAYHIIVSYDPRW